MSFFSKALGIDGKREKKQRAAEISEFGVPGGAKTLWGQQVQQYLDPTAGQAQLGDLIRSQTEAAMPSFLRALQGTRENAIRRGISTGDLGTTYEGDVASSFQQNIANAIAPQVFGLYQGNRGTYLDLLTGQMDRDQQEKNAKAQGKDNLMGGLLGLGGMALGGPLGGMVGKKVGSWF